MSAIAILLDRRFRVRLRLRNLNPTPGLHCDRPPENTGQHRTTPNIDSQPSGELTFCQRSIAK